MNSGGMTWLKIADKLVWITWNAPNDVSAPNKNNVGPNPVGNLPTPKAPTHKNTVIIHKYPSDGTTTR